MCSKEQFVNEEFVPVDSGFTSAELKCIADGANKSVVFDPDFRSQFEVKREAWQSGDALLSTSNRGVHLGPLQKPPHFPKKVLKKKPPKVGRKGARRNEWHATREKQADFGEPHFSEGNKKLVPMSGLRSRSVFPFSVLGCPLSIFSILERPTAQFLRFGIPRSRRIFERRTTVTVTIHFSADQQTPTTRGCAFP